MPLRKEAFLNVRYFYMNIKHKESGLKVISDVIEYDEIKRYHAGFIIEDSLGNKTQRIAVDDVMYDKLEIAESASIVAGKVAIIKYLNGKITLSFN